MISMANSTGLLYTVDQEQYATWKQRVSPELTKRAFVPEQNYNCTFQASAVDFSSLKKSSERNPVQGSEERINSSVPKQVQTDSRPKYSSLDFRKKTHNKPPKHFERKQKKFRMNAQVQKFRPPLPHGSFGCHGNSDSISAVEEGIKKISLSCAEFRKDLEDKKAKQFPRKYHGEKPRNSNMDHSKEDDSKIGKKVRIVLRQHSMPNGDVCKILIRPGKYNTEAIVDKRMGQKKKGSKTEGKLSSCLNTKLKKSKEREVDINKQSFDRNTPTLTHSSDIDNSHVNCQLNTSYVNRRSNNIDLDVPPICLHESAQNYSKPWDNYLMGMESGTLAKRNSTSASDTCANMRAVTQCDSENILKDRQTITGYDKHKPQPGIQEDNPKPVCNLNKLAKYDDNICDTRDRNIDKATLLCNGNKSMKRTHLDTVRSVEQIVDKEKKAASAPDRGKVHGINSTDTLKSNHDPGIVKKSINFSCERKHNTKDKTGKRKLKSNSFYKKNHRKQCKHKCHLDFPVMLPPKRLRLAMAKTENCADIYSAPKDDISKGYTTIPWDKNKHNTSSNPQKKRKKTHKEFTTSGSYRRKRKVIRKMYSDFDYTYTNSKRKGFPNKARSEHYVGEKQLYVKLHRLNPKTLVKWSKSHSHKTTPLKTMSCYKESSLKSYYDLISEAAFDNSAGCKHSSRSTSIYGSAYLPLYSTKTLKSSPTSVLGNSKSPTSDIPKFNDYTPPESPEHLETTDNIDQLNLHINVNKMNEKELCLSQMNDNENANSGFCKQIKIGNSELKNSITTSLCAKETHIEKCVLKDQNNTQMRVKQTKEINLLEEMSNAGQTYSHSITKPEDSIYIETPHKIDAKVGRKSCSKRRVEKDPNKSDDEISTDGYESNEDSDTEWCINVNTQTHRAKHSKKKQEHPTEDKIESAKEISKEKPTVAKISSATNPKLLCKINKAYLSKLGEKFRNVETKMKSVKKQIEVVKEIAEMSSFNSGTNVYSEDNSSAFPHSMIERQMEIPSQSTLIEGDKTCGVDESVVESDLNKTVTNANKPMDEDSRNYTPNETQAVVDDLVRENAEKSSESSRSSPQCPCSKEDLHTCENVTVVLEDSKSAVADESICETSESTIVVERMAQNDERNNHKSFSENQQLRLQRSEGDICKSNETNMSLNYNLKEEIQNMSYESSESSFSNGEKPTDKNCAKTENIQETIKEDKEEKIYIERKDMAIVKQSIEDIIDRVSSESDIVTDQQYQSSTRDTETPDKPDKELCNTLSTVNKREKILPKDPIQNQRESKEDPRSSDDLDTDKRKSTEPFVNPNNTSMKEELEKQDTLEERTSSHNTTEDISKSQNNTEEDVQSHNLQLEFKDNADESMCAVAPVMDNNLKDHPEDNARTDPNSIEEETLMIVGESGTNNKQDKETFEESSSPQDKVQSPEQCSTEVKECTMDKPTSEAEIVVTVSQDAFEENNNFEDPNIQMIVIEEAVCTTVEEVIAAEDTEACYVLADVSKVTASKLVESSSVIKTQAPIEVVQIASEENELQETEPNEITRVANEAVILEDDGTLVCEVTVGESTPENNTESSKDKEIESSGVQGENVYHKDSEMYSGQGEQLPYEYLNVGGETEVVSSDSDGSSRTEHIKYKEVDNIPVTQNSTTNVTDIGKSDVSIVVDMTEVASNVELETNIGTPVTHEQSGHVQACPENLDTNESDGQPHSSESDSHSNVPKNAEESEENEEESPIRLRRNTIEECEAATASISAYDAEGPVDTKNASELEKANINPVAVECSEETDMAVYYLQQEEAKLTESNESSQDTEAFSESEDVNSKLEVGGMNVTIRETCSPLDIYAEQEVQSQRITLQEAPVAQPWPKESISIEKTMAMVQKHSNNAPSNVSVQSVISNGTTSSTSSSVCSSTSNTWSLPIPPNVVQEPYKRQSRVTLCDGLDGHVIHIPDKDAYGAGKYRVGGNGSAVNNYGEKRKYPYPTPDPVLAAQYGPGLPDRRNLQEHKETHYSKRMKGDPMQMHPPIPPLTSSKNVTQPDKAYNIADPRFMHRATQGGPYFNNNMNYQPDLSAKQGHGMSSAYKRKDAPEMNGQVPPNNSMTVPAKNPYWPGYFNNYYEANQLRDPIIKSKEIATQQQAFSKQLSGREVLGSNGLYDNNNPVANNNTMGGRTDFGNTSIRNVLNMQKPGFYEPVSPADMDTAKGVQSNKTQPGTEKSGLEMQAASEKTVSANVSDNSGEDTLESQIEKNKQAMATKIRKVYSKFRNSKSEDEEFKSGERSEKAKDLDTSVILSEYHSKDPSNPPLNSKDIQAIVENLDREIKKREDELRTLYWRKSAMLYISQQLKEKQAENTEDQTKNKDEFVSNTTKAHQCSSTDTYSIIQNSSNSIISNGQTSECSVVVSQSSSVTASKPIDMTPISNSVISNHENSHSERSHSSVSVTESCQTAPKQTNPLNNHTQDQPVNFSAKPVPPLTTHPSLAAPSHQQRMATNQSTVTSVSTSPTSASVTRTSERYVSPSHKMPGTVPTTHPFPFYPQQGMPRTSMFHPNMELERNDLAPNQSSYERYERYHKSHSSSMVLDDCYICRQKMFNKSMYASSKSKQDKNSVAPSSVNTMHHPPNAAQYQRGVEQTMPETTMSKQDSVYSNKYLTNPHGHHWNPQTSQYLNSPHFWFYNHPQRAAMSSIWRPQLGFQERASGYSEQMFQSNLPWQHYQK